MSDDFSGPGETFVEVTQRSWLGRAAGSLIAVVIGLILFLGSFPVLIWNEGRAVAAIDTLNAGARSVVSVAADHIDPVHDGHLVHVTGVATVDHPAVDPVFGVAPVNAVRLRRHVEMYQWQEHKESQTDKQLGGGETTRTTYQYRKVWSETAIDSAGFKQPNGHGNAVMPLHSTMFDANGVRLGAFHLDEGLIGQMSGFKTLAPPTDATGAGVEPFFRRFGEGFYHGSSPETPAPGDIQVSFEVIETQPISVIAAQVGQRFAPFRTGKGPAIEAIDLGTHSAADMFQEAQASEATMTWILRGVGFVMMALGVGLMAAPLAWLASVLPVLEGVVDAAAFLVALIIAIPLTAITIAISWIAYRPLLGGGLIIVGLGLAILVRRLAGRRPPRFATPR
ncbi:MAG: TMEM43 family protein [Azospirillaceae bacterium]|nr:TMEM43 family protein [Azospirillaceae bacterium]